MARRKRNRSYGGLLAIGDPHLDGRRPGFRCDQYSDVILNKIQWCLDYAQRQNLLPVFLGDLFDKPRDNPNWMVTRMIDMLAAVECIGIFGNHDCRDPQLSENDSLQILVSAGSMTIVSQARPWTGTMNGRPTLIGGSSYRAEIPDRVDLPDSSFNMQTDLFGTATDSVSPFVAWITHHDILWNASHQQTNSLRPFPIQNCDVLINGHIHRRQETIDAGGTQWMNPGNISRRSRGEATRAHVPSALRIDVEKIGFTPTWIEIPHQPFGQVFYSEVTDSLADDDQPGSNFVVGLADLTSRLTDTGAGLTEFLDKNMDQFETDVADAVKSLAQEVLENAI